VDSEDRLVVGSAQQLADLLASQRTEILDACGAALAANRNAVAGDSALLEQTRAELGRILDDVDRSLRAGEAAVDMSFALAAREIGAARAVGNVHPDEALEVAAVFFGTVAQAASDLLGGSPEGLRLLALLSLLLVRSISDRVSEAYLAYTGFLLNKVHEVQVIERRRIARELHDRIGHCVSAVHQQLQLYGEYRQSDPPRADEKVEVARTAVREAMANLRAVTSELYTTAPLKSLQIALVNDLVLVNTGGVAARVRVNGDESWADPAVLDECFLILREAMRNTLHHGRAAVLAVTVDITPHEIRALVEDDGCGFDVGKPAASGGVGLSSMRERTELLGGRMTIRSKIGKGTQVMFTVPI
jgi:signal transduction histidine kinase